MTAHDVLTKLETLMPANAPSEAVGYMQAHGMPTCFVHMMAVDLNSASLGKTQTPLGDCTPTGWRPLAFHL